MTTISDLSWWPAFTAAAVAAGILVDCLIGAAVVVYIRKKGWPILKNHFRPEG